MESPLGVIASAGAAEPFWTWLSALASAGILAVAVWASGHALVFKRDARSAALWVIVIWLMPAAGPILYYLLGINRVRRRATALREDRLGIRQPPATMPVYHEPREDRLEPNLRGLAVLVKKVTGQPLLGCNRIEPLVNGEKAFPAMLQAIREAQLSVGLASYIFDGKGIGQEFVGALAELIRRGVQVRVLIDDVYVRFSFSSAYKSLVRAGVPTAVFNPPLIPARLHAAHLRNHRKVLIVDGRVGFTGGMNIHRPYWRPEQPAAAFQDLHFRIEGPVVSQLFEVFQEDWRFATGETLGGEAWQLRAAAAGSTPARAIEAGPDESLDRLRWVFLGALNAARRSVRLWTPYFVPDPSLIAALNAAALRGVTVDILLPERLDHAMVQWACMAQLWQVLEHGCRVWLRPPPFDHSKLLVIDESWICFGSANWDARSLRLNFELNVECYDATLGTQMAGLFDQVRAQARLLTKTELDSRALPIKLRDGFARLFAPYL
ncbi:MAG: phospholipase D-like domain-containing protein [Verrucomicrobiota bacterium]|nr:phospholipase D-like domain-containing protein [Limisphaera sp.]MDW8380490.1 phospholipase D-like domain-containing protein [Verrucomicrobiota bacterium]